MEIVKIDIDHLSHLNDLAACIGYFDGMHIGHMKLVSETICEANKRNLKSALITFDPDPWVVLKNETDIAHITSMDERIEIGKSLNIDYWIILPFTKQLSQLSNHEFEYMLKEIGIKSLICGFDYSYGYKGQGNIQTLKQQKYFEIIEVDPITHDNEKISSTRIEKELEKGNVHKMIHLLGRYYSIKGSVKNGNSLGNKIGFPTANLKLKYNSIIPKNGVYIGYTKLKNKYYRCMINIGHNPTFNYQKNISIETHLIEFNQNIYDEDIELIFIERIRDEQKFNSKEELISQLELDINKVYNLNKHF